MREVTLGRRTVPVDRSSPDNGQFSRPQCVLFALIGNDPDTFSSKEDLVEGVYMPPGPRSGDEANKSDSAHVRVVFANKLLDQHPAVEGR